MMKYLVLIVAIVATCGVAMADPTHPTGADLLKNANRAQPVQDCLDIPQSGIASGCGMDSNTAATVKTIFGQGLPAGTNKLGIKCATGLCYGTATVASPTVSGMVIATDTLVYFRGTTAELEGLYLVPTTRTTPASPTLYFFPFTIK